MKSQQAKRPQEMVGLNLAHASDGTGLVGQGCETFPGQNLFNPL